MAEAFGIAWGALTQTGATAVFMSLSDSDITLTVNGVAYPAISMAVIGNDHPTTDGNGDSFFGYYATQAVTFPKAWVSYTWSATQDGNTRSGTIRSAPGYHDDFSLMLTTCMNSRDANPSTQITAWDFFNDYTDHPPYAAIIHADDIIYSDNASVAGNADANGKDAPVNPATFGYYEYYYAFAYGHWFGICGPVTNLLGSTAWDAAFNSAFRSLQESTAFMPQWGDHEFLNNLGWHGGDDLTTDFPNAYWLDAVGTLGAPGAHDGVGLTAYRKVMNPLQGTIVDASHGNAWYADFGCLRYIAADPVSNAVPDTTCLGSAQIDDLLALPTASQWFTVLNTAAVAFRGTSGGDVETVVSDPGYKDENYVAAEFQQMMVADGASPLSFMDNPLTNGTNGQMVCVRGDAHKQGVYYFSKAAAGGLVDENFYEVGLDSVNNSFSDGRTAAVLLKVYGSRCPQEIYLERWELQGLTYSESSGDATFTDSKGGEWVRTFTRKWQRWNVNDGNYGTAVTDVGLVLPSVADATGDDE